MAILPDTINNVKDLLQAPQPLWLAEITFGDGTTAYFSTYPLNVGESGDSGMSGLTNPYLARIIDCSVTPSGQSDSGVDIPPAARLELADATKLLYTTYEVASGKGFRGAILTLRLMFYEADTILFSTDDRVTFIGRIDKPRFTNSTISLTASSLIAMTKTLFPIWTNQTRCQATFPRTSAERQAGADHRDSEWFECGYSPDATGGNARGNYESGSTPFTTCDYTFESCIARLGNSHTPPYSSGNYPAIQKDSSARQTGRFTGTRWVPPESWRGRSYVDGDKHAYGSNAAVNSRFTERIPMGWGTTWIDCLVQQVLGDPNSTRGEAVVGLGELEDILIVTCNETRLDPSTIGLTSGTPNAGLKDKLLRYDIVNPGTRDGIPNTDAIFDQQSDPNGSKAVIEWVVPKQLASSGSAPSVRALVRWNKIHVPDSNDPNDAPTWPRQYSESPVWQLLDVLTWGPWRYAQINIQSFLDADALCSPSVTYTDLSGNSTTHSRFSSSFSLKQPKSAKEVVSALLRNFDGFLYLSPVTGLLELGVRSTLAVQQSAPIAGSNYNTAISSKNLAGGAINGYVAYDFKDINIGRGSFSILDQPVSQSANRLSTQMIDQDRTYVEGTFSKIDTQDVTRVGQEVVGQLEILGLQNYDQANRIISRNLALNLRGNPNNDTRGTERIKFTASFMALHLHIGQIIRLSKINYGISNRLYRVDQVQPSKDYRTIELTCSYHNDDWYLDSYGQAPDQIYSDNERDRKDRPAFSWLPAYAAPITNDSVFAATDFGFDLKITYEAKADGSATAIAEITGQLTINNPASMKAPLVNPFGTTTTGGGGSLPDGRTYYLAVCAINSDGKLGPLSDPVVAITVPTGAGASKIAITVVLWDPLATGYVLFAGTSANNLSYQRSTTPTTSSPIELLSLTNGDYGPPDTEFTKYNVMTNIVAHSGLMGSGQNGAILNGVGNPTMTVIGAGWTVNQFAGYDVMVLAKGDGSTIPVADYEIVSNTADTLTLARNPLLDSIAIGDFVTILSKPTYGSNSTGQYIEDANWVNGAEVGFATDDQIGNLILFVAGPGKGQTAKITTNTATRLYVDKFPEQPTSDSRYIILYPDTQTDKPIGPFENGDPLSLVTFRPEITNYLRQVICIRVGTLDGGDNLSTPVFDPIRIAYVAGDPGSIIVQTNMIIGHTT